MKKNKGMFLTIGKGSVHSFFLLLLVGSLFTSCISHKDLTLLYDDGGKSNFTLKEAEAYKIRTGDLLDIHIKGPTSSDVEIFSKEFDQSVSGQASLAAMFLRGYPVDNEGNIEIPLVGKVKVKDYTLEQMSDTLESQLKAYLNFTTVTVKILNFRISVLGEVKSPGIQQIYFPDATVFQALAMAGDMTDLANRKRVKLLRHNADKKTIDVHLLNLRDNSLMVSEFYYLQPNDMIYVEPIKTKVIRVNAPTLTTIISLTTLLLLLYNISRKN